MRWHHAHGLTVALLLSSACGGDPSRPPASSDGWGPSDGLGNAAQGPIELPDPAPRPQAIPKPERKPWPRADLLAQLKAVPGRALSEHLDGGHERTVRINDLAADYLRLVSHRPLPTGALVAQRHHPVDSDAVESWYVMEKTAGGWTFLVLDPDAAVAAHEDLEACARCHADAPHDHLFGPPAQQDP